MKKLIFLAVALGLVMPASAFVFDNSVKYRWGDPFGSATDHYMEVHPGDTIALQIYTNDLDGQAWQKASNGAITCVYGDQSVIDYTAITETRGGYYSGYWPQTQTFMSGSGYWYKEYMGTTTRWVAEDRLIVTLNLTIRPDAPSGLTYVGLQQVFVWWYNYWVTKTTFFEQRIDDSNNPAYRMALLVLPNAVPGDFDNDGDIDADDIDLLCDNLGNVEYDLDGDNDADEDDMIYLIENLVELQDESGRVGTKAGDFNLDGVVNATDLAVMQGSFGLSGMGYAAGNANCDDVVNATDLAILGANFGFVAPPAGAVPEPVTVAMVGIGAMGLLRRRK